MASLGTTHRRVPKFKISKAAIRSHLCHHCHDQDRDRDSDRDLDRDRDRDSDLDLDSDRDLDLDRDHDLDCDCRCINKDSSLSAQKSVHGTLYTNSHDKPQNNFSSLWAKYAPQFV